MTIRPFVYAFSTDLRLDDHAGLAAAASRGAVVPMLVVDAELERRLRASPRRAAFFCGAAGALDAELRERESRLICKRGDAAQSVLDVVRACGAAGAAWSASYHREGVQRDRALQSRLEEAGLSAILVHDAPIVAPEDGVTPQAGGQRGYRAFAPYFERWYEQPVTSYESPLLLRFAPAVELGEPLPQAPDFGAAAIELAAGSRVAREDFDRFLRERAWRYSAAALLPAEDGTSRLGAQLSFGTISARHVARGVRERLGDPFALGEERLSLKRFLRSLARRDFFLQLAWFHPETQDEALQEKMRGFKPPCNDAGVAAWRAGRTGFPLVDAGIAQLHETGWMHPLVRAVAASVLCFDFGADWRVGRAEWDRCLMEDDPALATGNWQWIAGVGADMAQFPRIYNPERQERRCDPLGEYVRHWLPELRDLPTRRGRSRELESAQLALALFDGKSYPVPVVDHAVAAREFLTRYRAFVSP